MIRVRILCQPMPMPEQLPHITIFWTGCPHAWNSLAWLPQPSHEKEKGAALKGRNCTRLRLRMADGP
jgi:hypothetical protein